MVFLTWYGPGSGAKNESYGLLLLAGGVDIGAPIGTGVDIRIGVDAWDLGRAAWA